MIERSKSGTSLLFAALLLLSPFELASQIWRWGFLLGVLGVGMGQQTLIYSFVARGTVILSEYTEFTGNFTTIASQCLQKLPAANNKFTYDCDGHTFNYLVEDGYSESLPLRSIL
ncbi:hypothetical protein ZIOFF_056745 [Zingiber officinale]|uniref:Longin domain-containing protein n=1 Tax=Zingiber officinale TaxID=94328 RepID=A0A8J5FP42_ZINOF|nr:hypothetical protein ZIOFF_056745 [Zingiber officinale]